MKGKSTRILGLWNMGESQGFHERKDPRVLKDIIKCAYRNGVDTFDSAFAYGDADSMLFSAMKEMHLTEDRWHVIGKVMPVPSFQRKVDTELRRLGRSCLDVLLLHWPTEENLFSVMRELERTLDEGKALRIGVSNFPADMIARLSADFPISVHERAYSPIFMKDIDKETLPLLLYGCYGFGCLLRDGIPEDRRKTLYFYGRDAYPEFIKLRKLIKEMAGKYGTCESDMLLSFAESVNPEGIILGASGTAQAETLARKCIGIGNDDIMAIKKLGEGIESFNPSDNVFSHSWK